MRKFLTTISYLLVPLASAIVTYTFVGVNNPAIQLDEIQSLILWIAIIKMILLGSSGVFPIDVNDIVSTFMHRGTRNENSLFVVPPIHKFPCTRRLLCETETVARTSDSFRDEGPLGDNDRNLEEEINPIQEDPFTTMHTEVVNAFYRDTAKTNLTEKTKKALDVMEKLTGKSCEEAYRRCPGRLTPSDYMKAIFGEFRFKAHEEL